MRRLTSDFTPLGEMDYIKRAGINILLTNGVHIPIHFECYKDEDLKPGLYRALVADLQVYSGHNRESGRLRTVDEDQLVHVDEIHEDLLTRDEASIWGRISIGGWIVILVKGEQYIRARPLSVAETAKAVERTRVAESSGASPDPECSHKVP